MYSVACIGYIMMEDNNIIYINFSFLFFSSFRKYALKLNFDKLLHLCLLLLRVHKVQLDSVV